jgi:hypothetical protein
MLHFLGGTAVSSISVTSTTDFILYVHVLVCFMQLRKVLHSMDVFDSYCTFQSVVEVTFLAYVLNITRRFVMHNISYENVVHCICI